MITSKVVACFLVVAAAGEVGAQNTENIHFVETQAPDVLKNDTIPNTIITEKPTNSTTFRKQMQESESNFITKLYNSVIKAIKDFFAAPKVAVVFRNVGTCVVNGAMEIMTYYVPAPMIPLIASAAGMFIPFEPVVTLRERMPVTSYRRAFNKAVNSFMGTFEKFKNNNLDDDDPYMTKRFNRRMMNYSPEKRAKINEE